MEGGLQQRHPSHAQGYREMFGDAAVGRSNHKPSSTSAEVKEMWQPGHICGQRVAVGPVVGPMAAAGETLGGT
jgi:hypothetical protein